MSSPPVASADPGALPQRRLPNESCPNYRTAVQPCESRSATSPAGQEARWYNRRQRVTSVRRSRACRRHPQEEPGVLALVPASALPRADEGTAPLAARRPPEPHHLRPLKRLPARGLE